MKLSTVLQSRQNVKSVTTGINKYSEIDLLYNDLQDLVNSKFKSWYCGMFYKLGKSKVLDLASQARCDGKNSKKLFSYLLKKEVEL